MHECFFEVYRYRLVNWLVVVVAVVVAAFWLVTVEDSPAVGEGEVMISLNTIWLHDEERLEASGVGVGGEKGVEEW